MWGKDTFNPFGKAADNVSTVKEDSQYETEMCDVCCKSYNYRNIRRIPFVNKSGTLFVIRCCPYCNPENLAKYL